MTDGSESCGGSMGDHIARMVRKLREEQRMPYTQLADRLRKLGRPIPVLGLRRIERKERRVDMDELVALARALGTFPVRLVAPAGEAATTEVYPGATLDTAHALLWLTGELPFPTEPIVRNGSIAGYRASAADVNEWHRSGAEAVGMIRKHQRLLTEWRTSAMFADADAERSPDSRLTAESADRAHGALKELLDHRLAMEQRGMILPQIPLDDEPLAPPPHTGSAALRPRNGMTPASAETGSKVG